jgi:hypothetical protein
VSIDQTEDDLEARVVITLEWNRAQYLGTATGSSDATARPRLLGEATLRAIEALTPGGAPLGLEAIATTNLGEARVAMAQVAMESRSLVGSALLDGDDPAAAPVRAVLDAVNRSLARRL